MWQQAGNLDDGQAAAHPQQWRGLGRPIEGRRATHRRRRWWSLGRCPEGGPAAGRQQPRRGLCRRPTAQPALAGCGTMTAAAREGGRRTGRRSTRMSMAAAGPRQAGGGPEGSGPGRLRRARVLPSCLSRRRPADSRPGRGHGTLPGPNHLHSGTDDSVTIIINSGPMMDPGIWTQ